MIWGWNVPLRHLCVFNQRLCVCLCNAGDGASLGGVQQAGELCGAVEDGTAGTHEPQRHTSGDTWNCSSDHICHPSCFSLNLYLL